MRHLEVMLWVVVLLGSGDSPPSEGARRALIITNTEYKNLPWTPVDSSGAKALEEVLRDAQFAVSVTHDLNLNSLQDVIRAFQSNVHAGDTVLLYYAGYMKQGRQKNYLLPVDFDPASDLELYFTAYDLSVLLGDVAKNKPKLTMMILDSSWNTPKLGGLAGLTQPAQPSDTLIFASAGVDQVTTDTQVTSGKLGFFTSAFVKAVPVHGLDLTELVVKVKTDVESDSKDKQHPYFWNTFGSKFYFHEPDPSGERINSKDRLSYVYIPAGKFWMGCVPASEQCNADEKPRRRVEITKGFWLGQTEVTHLAFNEKYAKPNHIRPRPSNGVTNAGKQGDLPVVSVSWDEAQKYCNWAAEGGRLPTEAEWERAARGGNDGDVYPYPDLSTSRDYANFMGKHGNDVFDELAPVKQFNPNPYKLYDMAGNVWEWTLDWFDAGYYAETSKEPPIRDPQGPAHDKGEGHVARGGSWVSDAKTYLRISYRKPYKAGANNIGFRCLVPDTPEAMKNFK